MSHLVEQIQSEIPVSGNITATLDEQAKLGAVLGNSTGQTGAGTGNYIAGDYYNFYAGQSFPSGNATVSGTDIVLDKGTYFLRCVPTFGQLTSSIGNSEARMQFVDSHGNPIHGCLSSINRDNSPTYPAPCIVVGVAQGAGTYHLKIQAINAGTFPKGGTASNETNLSPYHLEIIRLN